MSEQTSSTAAGGMSGAAAGASVGSVAGPVGTAIGAIGGAIIGAVAGKKQYERQRKDREKEINRIESREDTAIQRATADSLAAGIDPRIAGTPPTGSPANEVPVVDAPATGEILSNGISAGATSAGMQLTQDFQTQQKIHADLLGTASQLYTQLGNQYALNVNESDRQINGLISNFAQYSNVGEKDVQTIVDGYTSTRQVATDTIKNVRVDEQTLNSLQGASTYERMNNILHASGYEFGGNVGFSRKKGFSIGADGKKTGNTTRASNSKFGESNTNTKQDSKLYSIDEQTAKRIADVYAKHHSSISLKSNESLSKKFSDNSLFEFYDQLTNLQDKKQKWTDRQRSFTDNPLEFVQKFLNFAGE